MSDMIPARKSQIPYYRDVPLYVRGEGNTFVLYKPAGMTIHDMRLTQGRLPPDLFIARQDKLRGLQEAQGAFNRELSDYVRQGNTDEIKNTVVSIVEETLSEPRSGSLEGLSETVHILVGDLSRDSSVVKSLIDLSSSDYTTTIHSINVMALSIRFAAYTNLSSAEAKTLGLSALLHDTGKNRMSADILTAPRPLTEREFFEMQRHCLDGYDTLKSCRFDDHRVCLAALEHHEKLDGSGYPTGKRSSEYFSQIIALIDCYEAVTADERPYRSAMAPLEALRLLKSDVEQGRYGRELFETFAYSLTQDV